MSSIRLEDADDLQRAVLEVLAEPDGEAHLRRTYHAWQMEAPDRAQQLAEAVGASLGRGGEATDEAVLTFFAHLPRGPGGDRVVAFVAGRPGHFRQGEGPSLAQALHVALSIGGDFVSPDPLVTGTARAEVLAGRGERLLYPLWRKDAAWMHEHLALLLERYPGRVDAAFYGLVDRGEAPEDALQRVIEAADPEGRRRLAEQIDWTTIFDPPVRRRLRRLLERQGD